MTNELCPKCLTEVQIAPGIGPYCPNKECEVIDNLKGTAAHALPSSKELVTLETWEAQEHPKFTWVALKIDGGYEYVAKVVHDDVTEEQYQLARARVDLIVKAPELLRENERLHWDREVALGQVRYLMKEQEAKYAEIERLRKREEDLLQANNRFNSAACDWQRKHESLYETFDNVYSENVALKGRTAHEPSACKWESDGCSTYHTGCGNQFTSDSDKPITDDFSFCPFCGGGLSPTKCAAPETKPANCERHGQIVETGCAACEAALNRPEVQR